MLRSQVGPHPLQGNIIPFGDPPPPQERRVLIVRGSGGPSPWAGSNRPGRGERSHPADRRRGAKPKAALAM